jgi:hypothetical protein
MTKPLFFFFFHPYGMFACTHNIVPDTPSFFFILSHGQFLYPFNQHDSASKYQGIDSLMYSGALHLYLYNQNYVYMLATYMSLYWYVYTDAL